MNPTIRLLSPTRRRIVTIDDTRRENDPHLARNLRHAGWTEYRGPAQTTTQGWVIRHTDVAIDMIAEPMHRNLGEEWNA